MRRQRAGQDWATGKTVLITGAARGIGAATARRMHARGASVALVGLEPDRLAALAGELGAERASWWEADVTDVDALRAAVDGAVERFGTLDVAIANAGVHFTGAFATSPLTRLEREVEVNLLGVLRTDHVVLEHLRRSRGYLLNVASLAAASHAPLMTSYAASKAGVEALSDSLRQELAPEGVGVGCAYFGFIDTDMVRNAEADPANARLLGMLPGFMRRSVHVEHAATAIELAVRDRRARTWAPRYVGAALVSRGWMQPLAERWSRMQQRRLRAALRLAAEAEGASRSSAAEGERVELVA
jgi:NAD(P)-dependent dehydrogenase (short-subunit alcohol dehydrogenase family)